MFTKIRHACFLSYTVASEGDNSRGGGVGGGGGGGGGGALRVMPRGGSGRGAPLPPS